MRSPFSIMKKQKRVYTVCFQMRASARICKRHSFSTLPPRTYLCNIFLSPNKRTHCVYTSPLHQSLFLLRQFFSELMRQQQNQKVTYANAHFIKKSAPKNERQPSIRRTINLATSIEVNFRFPLPWQADLNTITLEECFL